MTISIKDIAQKANVSTATVSRVINDSPLVKKNTKKKVLRIIQKYNYNPNLTARSLITGKSHLLTLIIPPHSSSVSPYQFNQITCGINDALLKSNYRLMILQPEGYCEKNGYALHVKDYHTDGFFIVSPINGDRLVKRLEIHKTPSVLIHGRSKNLDWVDLNNIQAVEKVIENLRKLGHKRIAFISENSKIFSVLSRLEGFRSALEKLKIPLDPNFVVNGDGQFKGGYECAKKLVALPNSPTAIFAMNDFMAMGAIRAITHAGFSVPKDISVFGFDDVDMAQLSHPSLSTVKQPFYEMGKVAAETLVERLENPNIPQKIIEFEGEIINRESCDEAKK